jgi:predicted regulator of Ras-like GTPase activity (Roadblock/LC7/MglB family)
MKEGLREINELVGVWGSLICNNQGKIIQGKTPPELNKPALENINRNLIGMFNTTDGSMERVSEAVLHYSEKLLFVLDLEQAFLVVICTPSIDISLLRMTVNIILSRWDGDPKVQKVFQNEFVERI